MVIEYIRYAIDGARHEVFERAYAEAGRSLTASSHCEAYEISRCVEDPDSYVVRIEWDSLEGHEQGFRGSPEFQAFFACVRPFFDDIQELRHYEAVDAGSVTGNGSLPD